MKIIYTIAIVLICLTTSANAAILWYNLTGPSSSFAGTNATVYFYIYDDGGACSNCINLTFEYNNSVTVTNTTTVRNNDPWANGTNVITLPSTAGSTAYWRWYMNSSLHGTSNVTMLFNLTVLRAISINVTDEVTNNTITSFNLTITNGTATQYLNNISNGVYNLNVIGTLTIKVIATNYITREYIANTNNPISIQSYMLKASDALAQTILVLDQSNNPITNSNVTLYKNINNAQQWLSTQLTDAAGTVTIYTHAGDSYILSITTPSGYSQTLTANAPASSLTPWLTIHANIAISGFNDSAPLNSTIWAINPLASLLFSNQTYNFTFYINSSDNALSWFGVNLTTYNNTPLWFVNSTNQPAGGFYNYSLNTGLYPNTNFTLRWWIKVNDYPLQFNYYYVYPVINSTILGSNLSNITLITILPVIGNNTQPLTKTILTVTIGMVVVSAVSNLIPLGTGLIALPILGIATLWGWIDWSIFLFLLIVAVGLFVIRTWSR